MGLPRRILDCSFAVSPHSTDRTPSPSSCLFFFNDTATTEIYTLSLHDALPICLGRLAGRLQGRGAGCDRFRMRPRKDRKSTRLNSSHSQISYAVFCLKKKKESEREAHLTWPPCRQT